MKIEQVKFWVDNVFDSYDDKLNKDEIEEAKSIVNKSLETVQRINDVLNVEGMTEIDALDEIMDAVSEFKYDCGVSE